MVPGQSRDDGARDSEPQYERIGGDVFDDDGPGVARAHRSAAGGFPVAPLRPHGPRRTGFRGPRRAAARVGRKAWREASSSFRSAGFWLFLVAAAVTAGGTTFVVAAWSGIFDWAAPNPLGMFVMAGAALVVSGAILGTAWGFSRPAAGTFALQQRLLACLLQGMALAVLGLLVLLVLRLLPFPAPDPLAVDPLVPGNVLPAGPALELLMVGLVLFEVLVFAAIGAGFRTMFSRARIGAVLAGLVTGSFVLGNLVAVALLMPAMLVTEQTSVPVNVKRDESQRYVSYECVGGLVRSQTVVHAERVLWLGAGNPVLLYWTLAAEELPPGSDYGWIFVSIQRSLEGPFYEIPCINGVASEELQPAFPLSVVGIAGQLATAAAVTGAGVLAARRRARR